MKTKRPHERAITKAVKAIRLVEQVRRDRGMQYWRGRRQFGLECEELRQKLFAIRPLQDKILIKLALIELLHLRHQ